MMKILVVDDLASARDHSVKILREAGHTVFEATNGVEALAMAKVHMPEVVVMDIVMPEMDGFEATKRLRSDPITAGIRIVVVSSKDQPSDMHWAKKKGASSYLIKPVKASELLRAIEVK